MVAPGTIKSERSVAPSHHSKAISPSGFLVRCVWGLPEDMCRRGPGGVKCLTEISNVLWALELMRGDWLRRRLWFPICKILQVRVPQSISSHHRESRGRLHWFGPAIESAMQVRGRQAGIQTPSSASNWGKENPFDQASEAMGWGDLRSLCGSRFPRSPVPR